MMNETHREIVLKLHIVCEKCGQLSLMSQANLSVLANCSEDNNGRVMVCIFQNVLGIIIEIEIFDLILSFQGSGAPR